MSVMAACESVKTMSSSRSSVPTIEKASSALRTAPISASVGSHMPSSSRSLVPTLPWAVPSRIHSTAAPHAQPFFIDPSE